MKRIEGAKFKEQCLNILDHLDSEGIIITKGSKPVALQFPIRAESSELIGSTKGKIKIKGDILTTALKWDVESEMNPKV